MFSLYLVADDKYSHGAKQCNLFNMLITQQEIDEEIMAGQRWGWRWGFKEYTPVLSNANWADPMENILKARTT